MSLTPLDSHLLCFSFPCKESNLVKYQSELELIFMFKKSVAKEENFDQAKENLSKGNSIFEAKGRTVKVIA